MSNLQSWVSETKGIYTYARHTSWPETRFFDGRAGEPVTPLPDALVLSADSPYPKEFKQSLFEHPVIRELFDVEKLILVEWPKTVKKAASGNTANLETPELVTSYFELVITHHTNYIPPFNDTLGAINLTYKHNDVVQTFNFQERLDSCPELYRDGGPEPCHECPHKGLTCVSRKFPMVDKKDLANNGRWPFILGPIRAGDEANGLRIPGDELNGIAGRDWWDIDNAMRIPHNKGCAAEQVLSSLETKLKNIQLGPCVFKTPLETRTGKEKLIETHMLRNPLQHDVIKFLKR